MPANDWKNLNSNLPDWLSRYLEDNNIGGQSVTRQRKTTASLLETLPQIFQGITGQIEPTEQAQLAASQAVSPEYAKLQQQLFRQNSLGTAQTTADTLGGPGKDITQNALDLQKLQDPEYFKTRQATASTLQDILANPLTGGELSGIERGLNRQFGAQGTLGLPSNTQQITAATTYGNQGRDRTLQALQAATSALPTFKSGVDTFGQAVKSPTEITGAFGGARETGGTTFPTAGGIASGTGQQAQTTFAGSEARRTQRAGQPANWEKVVGALPDYGYSSGVTASA